MFRMQLLKPILRRKRKNNISTEYKIYKIDRFRIEAVFVLLFRPQKTLWTSVSSLWYSVLVFLLHRETLSFHRGSQRNMRCLKEFLNKKLNCLQNIPNKCSDSNLIVYSINLLYLVENCINKLILNNS
jgi:hypothetical protein